MWATTVRINGSRGRGGTHLVTCPAGLPVSWLRGLGIQGWSEAHCHLVHVRPLYAYNAMHTKGLHFLPVQKLPPSPTQEGRDDMCLIQPDSPGSNLAAGTQQGINICSKNGLNVGPKCTVPEAWLAGWRLTICGTCRNNEN